MSKTGTFLGAEMSQTTKAIWIWELVLEHQPFKRFIDIGTWKGNLSLFFYLYSKARSADFYTYDVRNLWGKFIKEFKIELGFDKHFYQWDVFQHIQEIGNIIKQEGQSIVFCDNGNKPREFNTFAQFLKSGDIIAVHDWMKEIFPENIKVPCEKYNLKEIFTKESDEEGLTRFFQKI